MRALVRILSALFLALIPLVGSSLGQTLRFDHLDMNDGLSQSSVHAIVQDPAGFMWFGTEDGLNRFDGHDFRIFRHDPMDSASISSNIIIGLFIGRENDLWVATGDGIDRFEPENEAFERFGSSRDGARGSFTRTIDQTADGRLWASTDGNGLLVIDPASGAVRRFVHDPENPASLWGNRTYTARACGDSEVWVSSLEGLALVRLEPYLTVERIPDRGYGLTYDVRCTEEGDVWLAASGGLFRGNSMSGPLQRLTPTGSYRLADDGQGGVWVVTLSSGLIHASRDGTITLHQPDPLDPRSVPEDVLNSVYRDDVGTIWVGSASKGVSRFNALRQRFRHVELRRHVEPSLNSSLVSAALEGNDGTIWIGTGEGLFRTDSNLTRFEPVASAQGLPLKNIYSILQGEEDEIWVGGDGLCRLESRGSRCYSDDPANPRILPMNVVRDVYRDRQGTIWVATRAGLARYVAESDDFDLFVHDPNDGGSISHDDVRKVLEDSRGELWVGTVNGLNRLDRRTGRFTRYLNEQGNRRSLSNPLAWTLLEDARRRLWVGTLGGLNMYDPQSDGFIPFGSAEGLPSEVINCLLEDDRGRLWVSTNRGLSRLEIVNESPDAPALSVQNFTEDDGLQADEFHANACHGLSDGRMIFGGVNGFNIFHPDSIRLNEHVPPIVLTGVSVMGRPHDRPPLTLGDLRLRYNRNFFTFAFSALDYVSPKKNRHAYMLEGLDREWIDAGSRPQAVYTSVPPGRYTFRARGSNGDGVWNETGIALPIVILPPFWQTWWFRLLALAAVVAALATAYKLRVRRLLAVERMRLRIAGDLHDDIGASLGSIILLSDMVQRRPTLEANDRRRLQTITQTAREMADDLREIVWIVNPQNDRLGDLVERMRHTASTMLDGVPHSFNAPVRLATDTVDMAIRRNVLLIFKEILHNVRRHADAGRVEIEVREETGRLLFRVEDDGRGFYLGEDGLNHGHGLKSMQMRAREMGGELVVESEPGRGTKISGRIPYHANA